MTKPAQTLSVVVPVHNAERGLTATVAELLDVLADLTSRFEILIVDDGSTDQTEEVAHELTQRYPQVMFVRHAERRGIAASAQTGVVNTTGAVVVVHAGQSPVNTAELQRIWRQRDDEELVVKQCSGKRGTVSPDVFRGLVNWGKGISESREELSTFGGYAPRSPTPLPEICRHSYGCFS